MCSYFRSIHFSPKVRRNKTHREKESKTITVPPYLTSGMDPWQVKSMIQKYRAFNNTPGIVFGVNSTINPSNQSDPATNFLTITNIFSGYAICGASGSDFPMMCTTNFTNHYNALVEAQFMTDGTSASIAVNKVQNLGFTTAANFTWLATAMTNILEGSISSFQMYGEHTRQSNYETPKK